MGLRHLLLIFVSYNFVISCALGAAHMHSLDAHETQERELDGSYRPRDSDHYGGDGEHNYEFDHEAIIGRCRMPIPAVLLSLLLLWPVLQCS